jgi:hypothetical protein
MSLCTSCLHAKAVKGKTKCQKCLDYVKGKSLEYAYGVTPAEILRRRRKQKNRCAICGEKFVETPHMDHDHKTKQNRDLLCGSCNKGLGYFKDNPKALRNAARYVEKHKRRKK